MWHASPKQNCQKSVVTVLLFYSRRRGSRLRKFEEFESRFPSEITNVYSGFYVLPSNFLHCKSVDWKTEFMEFMHEYEDDLPNFRTIHAELEFWETTWKNGFEKVQYDNVAETLKN